MVSHMSYELAALEFAATGEIPKLTMDKFAIKSSQSCISSKHRDPFDEAEAAKQATSTKSNSSGTKCEKLAEPGDSYTAHFLSHTPNKKQATQETGSWAKTLPVKFDSSVNFAGYDSTTDPYCLFTQYVSFRSVMKNNAKYEKIDSKRFSPQRSPQRRNKPRNKDTQDLGPGWNGRIACWDQSKVYEADSDSFCPLAHSTLANKQRRRTRRLQRADDRAKRAVIAASASGWFPEDSLLPRSRTRRSKHAVNQELRNSRSFIASA